MRTGTSSDMRSMTAASTVQEGTDTPAIDVTATPARGNDSTHTMSQTLEEDMLRVAYHRFVYDFVASEDPNRPPDQPSDAFFSFVPLLYQHAEPTSCLRTAVDAVAYINYANRGNVDGVAAVCAEESYSKAIGLISEALRHPEKSASNDTLCSVLLIGIFEVRSLPLRQR